MRPYACDLCAVTHECNAPDSRPRRDAVDPGNVYYSAFMAVARLLTGPAQWFLDNRLKKPLTLQNTDV